jgi:hypothetical protein
VWRWRWQEFKDLTFDCTVQDSLRQPCPFRTGEDVLRLYSLDTDGQGTTAVWNNAAILLGLLVGFRLIAFLALYRRSAPLRLRA